jgi:tetratricopeptide (TPR) repeat protein
MREWIVAATVLAGTATACGPRGATSPPAPASSSTQTPADPTRVDDGDTASGDAAGADLPAPWWTPLPAISREPLTAAEQSGAVACADTYGIEAADVAADDLLAAAECLGDQRAFGRQLRVYAYLLDKYPATEHEPAVLLALGQRYEQVELRAQAIDAYRTYLRKYPKHDDARAGGQRAVCLARSLDDATTVADLVSDLERLYGRNGFVTPPPAALEQLCVGLPPVAR